jgi:hypothetical protein
MISKTSTPVCQSGGGIITDSLWVVRPAFVEGLPQKMIVCVACDRRMPQSDLNWYNQSREEGRERSCEM